MSSPLGFRCSSLRAGTEVLTQFLPDRLWRCAGPFVVFTVLVLLYFAPALLHRQVLAPGDGKDYYYPVRVNLTQTLTSRHLPLWNPHIFGGLPAAADPQVGAFFPPTWLFFLFSPVVAMNLLVLSSYILAGAFTVLYAREVGLDEWGSYGAGLIFTLGGFMVVHLGHLTMITAAPYLPLLLYCLEKLRTSVRIWSMAVGAMAVALSILSGHPQIPTYILMVAIPYLLFFGLIESPPAGRLRYLLAGTLSLFTGLFLAMVQILPLREFGALSMRETITYEFFTSYSLPLSHLLLFLFPFLFGSYPPLQVPWWGAWNFVELVGYVGIAPLMLLAAIVPLAGRVRCLLFWLAVAVGSLLMALGGSTPLAMVTYLIPGLNWFRAQGRHLMELSFAIALLAGFAITLLPRVAAARQKRLVAFGVAVVLIPLLGFWSGLPLIREQLIRSVASNPQASLPALRLTRMSAPLLTPAVLALLSGAIVTAFAWRVRTITRSLLLGVICLDLYLFGQGLEWRLSPSVEELKTMPEALRLLRAIDPHHSQYRILSLLQLEHNRKMASYPYASVLNPNRLMLHGIRNVTGYDPLMTARYANVLGNFLGQDIPLPLGSSLALDLLNVQYLLLGRPRLSPPTPRQERGLRFAPTLLDRSLSPPLTRIEFLLPAVSTTELAVVSRMGNALSIPNGQPVVKVTIWTDRGQRIERLVLAGRDTAEWAWDRPDVASQVKHRKARVAEDLPRNPVEDFRGHRYLARLSLGNRVSVTRVVFDYLAREAVFALDRCSFYDATTDTSFPVTVLDESPIDVGRWQPRVWTDGVGIFENRQALPRAWLVSQVRPLASEMILQAIHTGRLPDGEPFDPRQVALVEEGAALDLGFLDPIKTRVEVTDDGPNALTITTVSERPVFLVLSEAFFPGWIATLDGNRVPVLRTNYLLRGLPVPAGSHRIRFVYTPLQMALGVLISGGTLLALLVVVRAWRRK